MIATSDHPSDLTNCDREPIHIPGAIQAHGFLVCLDPSFKVRICSENCLEYLGVTAEQLLGRPFLDFVSENDRSRAESALCLAAPEAENPLRLEMNLQSGETRKFDCSANRLQNKIILEFEPTALQSDSEFKSFYRLATKSIERVRAATCLQELYQHSVDEARRVSGFDRVVIYKFDHIWNGHVTAESKTADAHSYLDLHFPASDIPKQVRDLYFVNPLRNIPATEYLPSQLYADDFSEAANLDLSLTSLRNVSPIHVEYLKNMQVTASMSASIFKNDRLWGIISCSHESGPNYLSFDMRAVCTFIAATLSSLLPYYEDREDSQLRLQLTKLKDRLVLKMTDSVRFVDGLFVASDDLLQLTGATGVAAFFDGEWRTTGLTPLAATLDQIRSVVAERMVENTFVTDALSSYINLDAGTADIASGVLALAISRSKVNYIIWFRQEVIQTVKWGGNPNKPVETKGTQRILHPRKSFDLWKETVRHRSLPWSAEHVEAAESLRSGITDIVLQRVEQVTKLNTELERSNVELDSFAYAASHDLKEPLRGIANYAEMILRDPDSQLSDKSHERLTTVARLSLRAEGLINSLLDYSQVGRAELIVENVSLNDIVAGAIDTLKSLIEKTGAQIEVSSLPQLLADRVQLNEVFTNLIVNSIKYNTSAVKSIKISLVEQAHFDPEFFTISVRDNGIGISPAFHSSVFKIFKRLHSKGEFGGGTGTGLTIVKKILERHGGTIFVESQLGSGTAFMIKLPRIQS